MKFMFSKSAACRRPSVSVSGAFALFLVALVSATPTRGEVIEVDICVFGGTSAGIISAVQAAKMGKSVVIAEPGSYLGGLTTGGLGATDIGNKAGCRRDSRADPSASAAPAAR